MYTALEFERALARGDNMDITLVNHDNVFLFPPMLHEVAANDFDITNIAIPIRKLPSRVTFFHGESETVDLLQQRVVACHMDTRSIVIRCRTTIWCWLLGPPLTFSRSQAGRIGRSP